MTLKTIAFSRLNLKPNYLILALASACLVPGTALADIFTLTGSEQQFTAPTAGEYDIVAYGGAGGGSSISGTTGGLGAQMGGDFTLTAGEILDIYVGGAGQTGFSAGDGGGGSFVVVDSTATPLVVAGGGGGANFAHDGQAGQTAVVN